MKAEYNKLIVLGDSPVDASYKLEDCALQFCDNWRSVKEWSSPPQVYLEDLERSTQKILLLLKEEFDESNPVILDGFIGWKYGYIYASI